MTRLEVLEVLGSDCALINNNKRSLEEADQEAVELVSSCTSL